MVQETSTVVKRRTNALKNLQLKLGDLETKLADEVHKLECKYAKLFEPIYQQREKIVNGEYEPTEAEATWDYQDDLSDEEEENGGGSAQKKQKTEGGSSSSSEVKGLPEFWLTAFQGNSLLNGLISERDESVLKHLRDVKVKLNETNRGYTIEFHFNENEFFTNKVLTKTYEMNTEKSKSNPLSPNLPAVYKCVGTKIEWKAGKDVTVKESKPTGKSPRKNSQEDDEDEEESSFFQIFDTHTDDGVNPIFKESAKDMEPEELDQIAQAFEIDFEVGQALKDLVVPKAVLYYTGEIEDGDEDEDMFGMPGEEDEEDEDDDDDDDDDESEEEQPKKKKSSK